MSSLRGEKDAEGGGVGQEPITCVYSCRNTASYNAGCKRGEREEDWLDMGRPRERGVATEEEGEAAAAVAAVVGVGVDGRCFSRARCCSTTLRYRWAGGEERGEAGEAVARLLCAAARPSSPTFFSFPSFHSCPPSIHAHTSALHGRTREVKVEEEESAVGERPLTWLPAARKTVFTCCSHC